MPELIKSNDQPSWFDLKNYSNEDKLSNECWLANFSRRHTFERTIDILQNYGQPIENGLLEEWILNNPIIHCPDDYDGTSKSTFIQPIDSIQSGCLEDIQNIPSVVELELSNFVEYSTYIKRLEAFSKKEMHFIECNNKNDASHNIGVNLINLKVASAKQNFDFLKEKQSRLLIDLRYSDSKLVNQFKLWLRTKRKKNGDVKQIKPSKIEKAKNKNYKILAYFDMQLWEKINKTKIKKQRLVNLLYPDQDRSHNYINKTIHPLFEKINQEVTENNSKRLTEIDEP